MNIADVILNPETINHIYNGFPSMENVDVIEAAFHRDGPRVALRVDLSDYPCAPPAKWKAQGFNTVQVVLTCLGLSKVEFSRWGTNNRCRIEISREENRTVVVSIKGGSMELYIRCDALYIDSVTAYYKK